MSGTQAQFELRINTKREARAALANELARVPSDGGRVEVTEVDDALRVRAYFGAEAEARVELLLRVARKAAALGATGEGLVLVLEDFQAEEGWSIELTRGRCTLSELSAKRLHARYRELDALLEACVMPASMPETLSDGELLRLAATARAALRGWSSEEIERTFLQIKATTLTSASFVSKAQAKRVLDLTGPQEWLPALPLRLWVELDRPKAEPLVLDLLARPTLEGEAHWLLLEGLSGSTSERAFEWLRSASEDPPSDASGARLLLWNAARGALARSLHPKAGTLVRERATQWLETARAAELTQSSDPRALGLLSMLELRGDIETLRSVWEKFYSQRRKIPPGADEIPAHAARALIECSLRDAAPALAKKVRAAYPNVRGTLDQWALALSKCNDAIAAARSAPPRREKGERPSRRKAPRRA